MRRERRPEDAHLHPLRRPRPLPRVRQQRPLPPRPDARRRRDRPPLPERNLVTLVQAAPATHGPLSHRARRPPATLDEGHLRDPPLHLRAGPLQAAGTGTRLYSGWVRI